MAKEGRLRFHLWWVLHCISLVASWKIFGVILQIFHSTDCCIASNYYYKKFNISSWPLIYQNPFISFVSCSSVDSLFSLLSSNSDNTAFLLISHSFSIFQNPGPRLSCYKLHQITVELSLLILASFLLLFLFLEFLLFSRASGFCSFFVNFLLWFPCLSFLSVSR